MLDVLAALPSFRLKPRLFPAMTRLTLLKRAGLALATAGALSLTACSQAPTETAKQAAEQAGQAVKEGAAATGEAAKQAATATGQAALAPAVQPVLDLLNKSEGDIKAGNLGGAVAAMGGFKAIWDKAAPVIQPLAGDKWPAINTAANLVISTFDKGATPDAGAAGSAITGLIGPLSGLLGK
jgi:hypothetical protein